MQPPELSIAQRELPIPYFFISDRQVAEWAAMRVTAELRKIFPVGRFLVQADKPTVTQQAQRFQIEITYSLAMIPDLQEMLQLTLQVLLYPIGLLFPDGGAAFLSR